jgi:hypothetical protein
MYTDSAVGVDGVGGGEATRKGNSTENRGQEDRRKQFGNLSKLLDKVDVV